MMSVFKIEKNSNYTVMSNYHLRDRDLSYKAKGLLSFILSLPEDWDYSLAGLCSISKESRDGIQSILKELQEHHYVEIEKVRGNKGYFEYNYLIYEVPHFISLENEQSNPDMENPHLDTQNLETTTQINTNIINTKKQIDKDDKTKISSFFVPEEHNRLILELIERGYMNEDDIQIFCYDKLFNKLLEEDNSYQDLIHEDGNIIENKFGYFKNLIISNVHRLNLDIDDLWGDDDLDSFYNFDDMYSDAQLQK